MPVLQMSPMGDCTIAAGATCWVQPARALSIRIWIHDLLQAAGEKRRQWWRSLVDSVHMWPDDMECILYTVSAFLALISGLQPHQNKFLKRSNPTLVTDGRAWRPPSRRACDPNLQVQCNQRICQCTIWTGCRQLQKRAGEHARGLGRTRSIQNARSRMGPLSPITGNQ